MRLLRHKFAPGLDANDPRENRSRVFSPVTGPIFRQVAIFVKEAVPERKLVAIDNIVDLSRNRGRSDAGEDLYQFVHLCSGKNSVRALW